MICWRREVDEVVESGRTRERNDSLEVLRRIGCGTLQSAQHPTRQQEIVIPLSTDICQ